MPAPLAALGDMQRVGLLEGGGICGSTLRLELDHLVPRGRSGSSEVENLRLLCRFHNQLTARATYGDDLMDRFAREVPRVSEPAARWGVASGKAAAA